MSMSNDLWDLEIIHQKQHLDTFKNTVLLDAPDAILSHDHTKNFQLTAEN